MIKLVALYKRPEDVAEFDRHYSEVHSPLMSKVPGLVRMEIPVAELELARHADHALDYVKAPLFTWTDGRSLPPSGSASSDDLQDLPGFQQEPGARLWGKPLHDDSSAGLRSTGGSQSSGTRRPAY